MKHESTYDKLLRRLDESVGLHQRIAVETGVSQSTVSRIYRREAVPRVTAADQILSWFCNYDREQARARRRQSAAVGPGARGAAVDRSGATGAAAPPLGG